MKSNIILTIGIPAFNRPQELEATLNSLANQCQNCTEIIVSEDCSPRAKEIELVVEIFSKKNPHLIIRYISNSENLGYDGNLRALVDHAAGSYILFMGDDDIATPNCLALVLEAIHANNNIGVILRAWETFDGNSGKILDTHHYFRGDRLFLPGKKTISIFFRRSVFISGLVVNVEHSRKLSSNRFDGTLLYQLYLVGGLLKHMNGYYINTVLTKRRAGGDHFFGSSKSEKKFTPKKLLPIHSLAFISGLLDISKFLNSSSQGVDILIRKDLARHSLPLLEIQEKQISKLEFIGYTLKLSRLGLGKSALFWIYFFMLFIFGSSTCNKMIQLIRTFKFKLEKNFING